MHRNLERILWGISLVLCAFYAGHQAKSLRQAETQLQKVHSTGSTKSSVRQRGATATHQMSVTRSWNPAGADTTLSNDEAETAFSAALTSPTRSERFARIGELLHHVTADNWMGLWEEYILSTVETGRVHEQEWALFMNRVGEVAGAEAMVYFETNGQPENSFNRLAVLKGWASTDLEAALRWTQTQSVETHEPTVVTVLLEGAAEHDPSLIFPILEQTSQDIQKNIDFFQIIENQVQHQGFANTINAFREQLNNSNNSSINYEVYRQMHSFLRTRIERMNWLSNAYPDLGDVNIPNISDLSERLQQMRPPPVDTTPEDQDPFENQNLVP